MNYRPLGRTQLAVSDLCLGTMTFRWTSTEEESYTVMDAAFEAGINFFDTADVYSNWVPGNPGGVAEEIIGKWLKMRRIPRDKIIIATKVRGRMWEGDDGEGLSRTHILRAVEDSLRRLQIDVIDLYQSHAFDDKTPHTHILRAVEDSLRRLQIDVIDLYQSHAFDDKTPQEETLRAYDDLIQQGKVRFIGCSNFKAPQLREALDLSQEHQLAQYDTLQPHYNLIWRGEFEDALQALCAQENIGVIPYSPLQGGFLTGKYKRGVPLPPNSRAARNERVKNWITDERALTLLDTLQAIAKERDSTMTATALAWMLTNPVVSSAIIGANSIAQLNESIAASGTSLSAEEMERLNTVSSWS